MMTLLECTIDLVNRYGSNGRWMVSRQAFIDMLPQFSANYTGAFLSNSERFTGTHSPNTKITERWSRGVYVINLQGF